MSTCPFLSKLPWVAEIQVLTPGGMLWCRPAGRQKSPDGQGQVACVAGVERGRGRGRG